MNEELPELMEELVRLGASYEMAMNGESAQLDAEVLVTKSAILALFESREVNRKQLAEALVGWRKELKKHNEAAHKNDCGERCVCGVLMEMDAALAAYAALEAKG
jgi:hypothetical protein